MKYALMLVIALAVAACGGDPYSAPPKGNTPSGTGGNASDSAPPTKQPTGPSRTREFNAEASAAQDAWNAFAKDKNGTTYAKCGAHIYNALRLSFEHEDNGHDLGTLRGLTELKRLKKDWSASLGQLTTEEQKAYEENEEYKQAKAAYDTAQQ